MSDSEFLLLGDAVWLDFVNSARGRDPSPPDLLPDIAAFGRWARILRLDPGEDRDSLGMVNRFRADLTELAEALDRGLAPPAGVVAAMNRILSRSIGRHQLTRVSGAWQLRFAPARPLAALEAVARSAAQTLADSVVRVRQCAGATCSLFFLDATPNGSRRWCCPVACGRAAWVERRRGPVR
jgi:predicted RNA-binding Zn ribbon-like protein